MAEKPGHSWKCLRLKSTLSHHFKKLRVWFLHVSIFFFCYLELKGIAKRVSKVLFCGLPSSPALVVDGLETLPCQQWKNINKLSGMQTNTLFSGKVILWQLVWKVKFCFSGGVSGSTYKTWKNCKLTASDTLPWLHFAQLLKTLGGWGWGMLQKLLQPSFWCFWKKKGRASVITTNPVMTKQRKTKPPPPNEKLVEITKAVKTKKQRREEKRTSKQHTNN